MNYEDAPGTWKDSSSLDFGAGSKSPETCYVECTHCAEIKTINERTVGVICSDCGRYFSVDKTKVFKSMPTMGPIKKHPKQAPHIVGENTKRMLNFRKDMEEKAYAFRDKQDAKRKRGEEPVHHGPIDPKTGKRIK